MFNDIINWKWSKYLKEKENFSHHTSYENAIFDVIDAIVNGSLKAIRIALERVDGKVETPVEVIYPKVYMLFPYAVTDSHSIQDDTPVAEKALVTKPKIDIETAGLRETVKLLGHSPLAAVDAIISNQEALSKDATADVWDPYVKSVVAAKLFMLSRGKLDAISEILDQIDGKVAEVVRVMGEDIYIVSYSKIAPQAAKINKDGVLQIEMPNTTNQWAIGLGKPNDND